MIQIIIDKNTWTKCKSDNYLFLLFWVFLLKKTCEKAPDCQIINITEHRLQSGETNRI